MKEKEEMNLKMQQALQEKEMEQQRIMQMLSQKMQEEQRMNSEELTKKFQMQLSLKEQEQLRIQQEHQKQLEQIKTETSKNSWELENTNDVMLETQIGEGQFGQVWKGRLFGKEVAIKKLLIQKLDEVALQDFKKELNLMSHLRHPNLLMFMAACTQPGNMMIITQFMHRGSLEKILHSDVPLSIRSRMKICKDIAMGMNWLHNQKPPIIHRDLKPANVNCFFYNSKKKKKCLQQIDNSQKFIFNFF